MNKLVSWFAENHVAANLLMVFLLIAGVFTALTMKLETMPDATLDQISISVEYPGASPAEVEEAILRRIEEKIAGLPGIDEIRSSANEGRGTVVVEIMKDWDQKKLLDEIKAEVDRITTFPEEAEQPIVRAVTRQLFVIMLAVYGDAPEATIKNMAEKIKDDLIAIPGITLAEVSGVRQGEIHIEISEDTLRRYGLTLEQVARAVRMGSLDMPAGSVKTSENEILIRTKGRRYYADDYRDIAVITDADGTKVTLGQIAQLSDGYQDVDLFARVKGNPAAIIQVYRVADQSALEVAAKVKDYVAKIKNELPAGIELSIFRDMSIMLKSRLTLLAKNLAYGLVLVIVILGLFLNVRAAFWVTLGIPVSFAAALWILPYFDVSLNMMSLFAFIMVLGIVVDDAIVVGESVYRNREEGLPPLKASIDGTLEVGKPVVFAVLTTVAAFWPLLLGTGGMGRMLSNIPYVIILVLLGSLLECLTILPAHLARSKISFNTSEKAGGGRKMMDRCLKGFVRGPYTKFLRFCLRWRYLVTGFSILVLLLTLGLYEGGWIKFTFFPPVPGNTLSCTLTMPAGVPVERTAEVVNRIQSAAYTALEALDNKRPQGAPPLIESSLAIIGTTAGGGPGPQSPTTGGHVARITVNIIDGSKRDISTIELANIWRNEVGPIPDAENINYSGFMFSAGNPIEVHLSMNDQDRLLEAADILKAELNGYPGVFDVGDSFIPGKKEMQLKLRPAARSLGLTLNDLANQVRHAFYGAEALRFQRGTDEVKVMVRYPDSERKSLRDVEEMRIRTSSGVAVPFSQVAEVTMEQGYTTIERVQRLRIIKVTADVDESVTNANDVRSDLESRVLPYLKSAFSGLRYSVEGAGKHQRESLADVAKGFVIALFCIYALLAIPFKSFLQPLVVMQAIPFGMVGAVFGHIIMDYNISINSLFGMVGLSGVVVNDSLVLIHAANRIRDKGVSSFEAVSQGAALRFRAIILTSLTTFGGLTPMLMEKSLEAQFMTPMAISLGFGVLFATGITLLLIPCGYLILDDFHRVIEKLKVKPSTQHTTPDKLPPKEPLEV
jgi:multidrug efflux pump subunit AcrB